MKRIICFIFSNVGVVKVLTTGTLEKMKLMSGFIRKNNDGVNPIFTGLQGRIQLEKGRTRPQTVNDLSLKDKFE